VGPSSIGSHPSSSTADSSSSEGNTSSPESSFVNGEEFFAMKKVKMGKLSEREKQNALNEVRILASIHHPNIIGYKEAFFEEASQSLCIVMEFADGGDLLGKIGDLKKKGAHLEEKEVWQYFVQIARGLKALHDLKICHRDIKCANVFLTKEGIIKLGDLNVSKVAKKGMLHTQTGTPYYASPEVWKDKPYDSKSDIWSLGCVLYEMAALVPPFRAAHMTGLYQKVLKAAYDPLPSYFSKDLSIMVRTCLNVQPTARPTCDKILATQTVSRNLSDTIRDKIDFEEEGGDSSPNHRRRLLNTIRVPKDLV
jgi:NIMA (never in mitosis gene a)-related kinase 1/4/5